jgi:hypothetical protein
MNSIKTVRVFFGGDISYKSIIYHFLKPNSTIIEVTNLRDADLVYWVYGRGPTLNFKNLFFWISNRQKFILHWIGTDVLTHVSKLQSRKIKTFIYHHFWNFLIKRKIKNNSMLCLCCAPWLCRELEEVGVSAQYIPLTTIENRNQEFEEEERTYDFMTYLPQGRLEIYNGETILQIAGVLTEYKFLIIVPDINDLSELKLHYKAQNITFQTKVDFKEMQTLYRNSKCFLRFTKHDGLSLSVMEATINRMHVFWTYEFPFVQKVDIKNEEELKILLKRKIENWSPNYEGQTYILNEFRIDRIAEKFTNLFTPFL